MISKFIIDSICIFTASSPTVTWCTATDTDISYQLLPQGYTIIRTN